MAPTKPPPNIKSKKEKKSGVNEDDIIAALAYRYREGTSFRTLALLFNIPSSTLADRTRGGLSWKESHVHQQRLTPAMEKALVAWCKQLDDWGFPPRMDLQLAMAKALAQQWADEEEDPTLAGLGKRWVGNFLKRHPELAATYGTQLDRQRAYTSHLPTLRHYFQKLEQVIWKYGLKPEDIFNMDKKGFIIGRSSRAKVVCRAGRRPARVTQDGTQEMLTVVECCCAAGYVVPSFVIYKGTAQYMGWYSETNDLDVMFTCSPNGWTDNELGLEWLYHFDRCTKNRKGGSSTRLLIVDGHLSHLTLEFIQYAIDNNIQLLCFPPHTTYLLQPLHVGLFAPLQKYYGKAADDHIWDTRTGILKGTFWKLYRTARRQAYTKKNIASAFCATGIYPFNPAAIAKMIVGVNPTPASVSTAATSSQPSADILAQLKTPRKSRDVHQQTQLAIEVLRQTGDVNITIAVVERYGHTAQTALATAEIQGIELADVHQQYGGKKVAVTNRRVITKACVIKGADLIRMIDERVEADRLKEEKELRKLALSKPKAPPRGKRPKVSPNYLLLIFFL